MATVSAFPLMSTQQQEIEKTWYSVMIQLASAASATTEIVLPSELKDRLGSDGVAAIAQRCSTFSNAQVEVKDDTATDSVRISVLSPGSRSQSDDTAASSPESVDSPKKDAKVSRPPNAFILYRKHHHNSIVAQNPGLHNNEISKIIGKMWRDETETVKQEWKGKAENVKRQHLRDHPDYQYQPRKPHEKKRRMTKRKALALAAQQTSPSPSISSTATFDFNAGGNSSNNMPTFSPAAPTIGPFSSITSPSQIVDLGYTDSPTLDYSANGNLASFTLDTFQPGQLNLFADILDEHNQEFADPVPSIRMPAANTVLPTAINNAMADGFGAASLLPTSTVNPANDLSLAESDLSNFESSLEDLLAKELESMEQDVGQSADAVDAAPADPNSFQYNDLESQRFTEFLQQMPEHMWGMEFVN